MTDISAVPGSADALREVMGHFASGVTIVTAVRDGVRHAMTATAVSSVSLDPPLVLVCVSRTSRFHRAVMDAGSWGISLLRADQEHLARHFAHRGRNLSTQFDQVPHTVLEPAGTPVIDDALAWMECSTYAQHDGGDHTILVGQVMRASAAGGLDDQAPAAPLTYYRGAYSALPAEEMWTVREL